MTEKIAKILKSVINEDIDVSVSASERFGFGHYSSNVAFKLAKIQGKSPLQVAQDLSEKLSSPSTSSGSIFAKIEAVAPGFVNFWLKPEVLQKELKTILVKKK